MNTDDLISHSRSSWRKACYWLLTIDFEVHYSPLAAIFHGEKILGTRWNHEAFAFRSKIGIFKNSEIWTIRPEVVPKFRNLEKIAFHSTIPTHAQFFQFYGVNLLCFLVGLGNLVIDWNGFVLLPGTVNQKITSHLRLDIFVQRKAEWNFSLNGNFP